VAQGLQGGIRLEKGGREDKGQLKSGNRLGAFSVSVLRSDISFLVMHNLQGLRKSIVFNGDCVL
jgi:hypothetical protein